MAGELESPLSQVLALAYAALLNQIRGDIKTCQKLASQGYELAIKHGDGYYQRWCAILLTYIKVIEQPGEENIKQLEERVLDMQTIGTGLRLPYYYSLLAQGLASLGRWEEAIQRIEAALFFAEQNNEHFWEPELLRLKGEYLLNNNGDKGEARITSRANMGKMPNPL